jgi:hypothetical protein
MAPSRYLSSGRRRIRRHPSWPALRRGNVWPSRVRSACAICRCLREKKPIGIVSIGDLVKSTIGHQKFLIDQLEHYIRGERVIVDG